MSTNKNYPDRIQKLISFPIKALRNIFLKQNANKNINIFWRVTFLLFHFWPKGIVRKLGEEDLVEAVIKCH